MGESSALPHAETLDLIVRAQAGDEEAQERLVVCNAPLVRSIVRKFAGRGAEYARSGEMNNREKYNLTVEGPKFGQRRFEVVNVDSGKNAYAVPVLTGLVVGLLIIVAALLFVNFAYADSSEIGGMLDAGAQGAVKAGTPGGEREIFAERLK